MKRLIVLCLALVMAFSLAACGNHDSDNTDPSESNNTPVALDVQEVYTKVGQAVEMPEMLALNESLMLDYCGIAAEDVKQAIVYICADSLRTDETWLIEAVDEAAAKRIVDLANARLKTKGDESITYSPEQYAVVEKAQLLQQGNYIALFVSPDAEAMANVFRQEAGM